MPIEGLNNAKRNLREFVRAAFETVEPALTAGALIIKNSAQDKAAYKSGTLRRGIHTETVENTRSSVMVAVGPSVGTPYARRIEMGFCGADALGRVYNQPPRPYMRPAYYENKDLIEREVFETLQQLSGRKT